MYAHTDKRTTDYKEQKAINHYILMACKTPLSLTLNTHAIRQKRQGVGCETERLRSKRGREVKNQAETQSNKDCGRVLPP